MCARKPRIYAASLRNYGGCDQLDLLRFGRLHPERLDLLGNRCCFGRWFLVHYEEDQREEVRLNFEMMKGLLLRRGSLVFWGAGRGSGIV